MENSNAVQVERGELARMLADGLRDLGYYESAQQLEKESGFRATSAPCEELLALLNKQYFDLALPLLNRMRFKPSDDVGRARARNLILQEQYLTLLLNENDAMKALAFLRKELLCSPQQHHHHQSKEDLIELATLLACPTRQSILSRWKQFRTRQFVSFGMEEPISSSPTLMEGIKFLVDTDSLVPTRRMFTLLAQSLLYQRPSDSAAALREYKRFKRSFDFPYPLLRPVEDMEIERSKFFLPSALASIERTLDDENDNMSIAFHPNGSQVAIGSSKGRITVLDSMTLQQLYIFEPKSPGPVVDLDWQAVDGLLVVQLPPAKCVAAHTSFYPQEFDTTKTNFALIHVIAMTGDSRHAAPPLPETCFHSGRPHAKWINTLEVCSAGPDGWLRRWRYKPSSSDLVQVFCVAVERVLDLNVMWDEGLCLLACADSTIRAYSGQQMVMEIPTHSFPIRSLVCSSKNRHAIALMRTTTSNRLVVFTSNQDDSEDFVLGNNDHGGQVKPMALNSGDFVAMGREDGTVDVWELPACRQRTARLNPLRNIAPVLALAWNPNSMGHIIAVGRNGAVTLWIQQEQDEEKRMEEQS